MMIAALGWAAAVAAGIGTLYGLVAGLLATRFMARPEPAPRAFPAVSLVKPLHGDHPGLAEALEGFCDQDYPGDIQIIFGVHHASDSAIPIVRALQARRPGADIELVIDARLHGTNRKVSNLINIAARARHDVLVLSDADIGVGRRYLRQVVGALGAPGVGAVSCLYVGKDDGSVWSRLGAMAINYHFLPNAVLGKSLGLAQPCFGSTIAMTSRVLAQIGGLSAFADHLADDYEIGRAVRAQGWAIAIPPMVVSHLHVEPSGRGLLGHELRWGRTVRQINPFGYAGSIITYPLPLALVAGLLLGFPPSMVALIASAFGVRIASKFAMDSILSTSAGHWWMIPARDVLSFGVFMATFAVNTVAWQGQRFRVGRDGVVSHSQG
jgi:ceramide glucosyltransferase